MAVVRVFQFMKFSACKFMRVRIPSAFCGGSPLLQVVSVALVIGVAHGVEEPRIHLLRAHGPESKNDF